MKFNLLVVVPPGPLGLTIAPDKDGYCSVTEVKSESVEAFFKRGDILLSLNGQPLFRKAPALAAAAASGSSGINAEMIKDWVETVANSSYLERHIAVYRRSEHQQEQTRNNNDTNKKAASKPKAAPKIASKAVATAAATAPVPVAAPVVAAAKKEPVTDSTMQQQQPQPQQQQNEEKNGPPKYRGRWLEDERDDPDGLLKVVKCISELRRAFDKDGKKPTLLVAKQIRWILFEGVMLLAEKSGDEKNGMMTVKFGSQVGGAPQTWVRPSQARLGTSKKSQNSMSQEVMSVFDHVTANLSDPKVRSDFAAELCKKIYYEHGPGRRLYSTDNEERQHQQKVCIFDIPQEMLDIAQREYEKAHPTPQRIPTIFERFPAVREEIVTYAKAHVNDAGMVTKAQMVTYVNDELIPGKMAEWMQQHAAYCDRRAAARVPPETVADFTKRVIKLPYPIVPRNVTTWLTLLGFRVVPYHKSFCPPDKAPGPQEALVHSQKAHRMDRIFHDQDGETQCSAISTRGRQCTFIAIEPTRYCSVHADYETNPPKMKKRRLSNGIDDKAGSPGRAARHNSTDEDDDESDTEEENEAQQQKQQHHQPQQQQHLQQRHHAVVAMTQPVEERHGYHRYY